MRSQVLSVSSVRLFRLAIGTLLLLAGTALLLAQGIAWLGLEPRMLRALEGGALCALGTALGAVPVLVIRNMPVALADTERQQFLQRRARIEVATPVAQVVVGQQDLRDGPIEEPLPQRDQLRLPECGQRLPFGHRGAGLRLAVQQAASRRHRA